MSSLLSYWWVLASIPPATSLHFHLLHIIDIIIEQEEEDLVDVASDNRRENAAATATPVIHSGALQYVHAWINRLDLNGVGGLE